MKPRQNPNTTLFIMTLVLASLLAGCSDSPTDPETGGGGGGPVIENDVPDIPQPTTLGGDVPATSATLTRIEKLEGVFRPHVLGAYGTWEGSKICSNGDQEFLTSVIDWSLNLNRNLEFAQIAALLPGRNIAFLDESGSEIFPVFSLDYLGPGCGDQLPAIISAVFRGGKFGTPVHIRRDRRWELKPLEGNAGDYLLVFPQTTGEVSSTYTSGIESGQTIEFGKSLTVSAGLGIGPLSVSVSGTLSETFSSSVTVSESKSETFTKSVTGLSGKVLQFMVWELVETYSFTDAEGNKLVSEDYFFVDEVLVRRGSAIALQSTEFEVP
jgi:hypothetical protein